MNVHVHVEQIVLDGLPMSPNGRAAFTAAFTEELGQRIAEAQPPAVSDHQARLAIPALIMAANATPAQLGTRLATAISTSLTKNGPGNAASSGLERRPA